MENYNLRRDKSVGRRREVAALLLLFGTLLLALGMISYLVPFFGAKPELQAPQQNWIGALGFYSAHFLFSFLGLSAFFPLSLLALSTIRIVCGQKSERRLLLLVLGFSGLALASSGLLGGINAVHPPFDLLQPGGFLGTLIWQLLDRILGTVGTVLFLIFVLVFSLMAALQASVFRLFQRSNRQTGNEFRKKRKEKKKSGQTTYFAEDPQQAPSLEDNFRRIPVYEKESFADEIDVELDDEPEELDEDSPPAYEQEKFEPEPEPHKVEPPAKPVVRAQSRNQKAPAQREAGHYTLPSLSLLDENEQIGVEQDQEHYYEVCRILLEKLQDFGVKGEVAGISPGPVVTTYEFSPAPGVKISRVVSLADDLAMVLKVDRVRIVGSIPGKVAIGIEIPNPVRSTVYLRDILMSQEYQTARSKLSLALGFDVVGQPVVANLARMPHLLIAGATGAGKSVAINAFIASILFKSTPEEVRLLMIDPKRIELSVYDDIPHLLHPVVVEAKMASRALLWAVREMERRYRLLEESRVKSFMTYNEVADEPLPYIVIIVDELADLMMVASKDVETSIARLAQMARAAGMHIVLATQRPSVDVLTGLIKANFPTRISFKVSSKVDSRTILDGSGAEHLLGMGDMLFLPPGAAKLQRIHGAYISEQETERLVEYVKSQGQPKYDEAVAREMEAVPEAGTEEGEAYDEKYDEAVSVVTETGVASISMVQRRLRVGYNRAARMIELMEREGIVGPADGSRPREVLVRNDYDS